MLPPASAHVFVADLDDLRLDPGDDHHLARVLRLRDGETVTVCDGRGRYRTAAWRPKGLEPTGPVTAVPPPEPPLTVAFSLTKGTKPEWAVQRLTEAGVDRVQPLVAARSVVQWDESKAGRAAERLARVAREAAMQARRAWLPEIGTVVGFAEFVRRPESVAGAAIAQMDGEPPSLARPSLLIGPEGGWTDEELACGLPAVSLGPAVLRAETAALAAGILLAALRGRLVKAAHS